MSPISIVGIDGPPPPRLLFPLEFSSRLILIIEIQSSSGPSRLPLPFGRDSAPPVPLRVLRPAASPAGTDSTIPPASRTLAATLPPGPALSTTRPPGRFFRYARRQRWPGRN